MVLTPEILVPKLGDFLVERGLITDHDLQEAMKSQARDRREGKEPSLLGKLLEDMGCIDRATLDGAITEQILELRHALIDARKQLQLRVEERTAELACTLEKLDNLNKLQTRFVANISHELRTPLYHLTGYLELLAGEDLGPLNAEQQQTLSVIQRAAERLGTLIEDLILFTATGERPLVLRLQTVAVQPACEAAIAQSLEAAEKARISLTLECASDLPPVRAHQEKLSWIIRHLLENALKFTPAGGSVTMKVEEKDGGVIFSIRDTGIGIPQGCCAEIFEPFRQLDDSVSRRYGGMGLGLALVRKIIQAHGSDIQVTSEVEKGSTFSFRLPVAI